LPIDGADVVVNLAGRSVNCRYTRKNRQEIMDSRLRVGGVERRTRARSSCDRR
jgi:NAD dependent epimerase/dehydratase family enzyme